MTPGEDANRSQESMPFLQLVRREMPGSLTRLILMSGMAGASNFAMLATINSAAQAAGHGRTSLWTAGLFLISLFLFVKAQNYLLITATAEIEAVIHKLRLRLMDYVRHSELLSLELIGRVEITTVITVETAALKQAANTLVFACQGIVLIAFVAVYIAYLSPWAFVMSVVVVAVVGALYHARGRHLAASVSKASHWETTLFERLDDLLGGFKEVRLNRARSDELFDDAVEVSRAAANIKIRTQSETYKRMVFAQSSMYLLLGAIVFVVPALSDVQGGGIMKGTMALIFVVGVFFGLIQSIPVLATANSATENIGRLEAKLRMSADESEVYHQLPLMGFRQIEMRNVVFRYLDKNSEVAFQVGPLDFSLRSSELIFITGGNGSGKSTFLKLLAGLYEPDSGEIIFDDVPVDASTREAYRALMAAIFSDYHLFQKLYGIHNLEPTEIDRLLAQFQLSDKIRIADEEFSTLDLSGGQRKRVALIVSLLEKRPVLLLDEWTAEQDPEFRRKFYDYVLPVLHQAGVTVVMATHDDRHLDGLQLPARRLRMDEGRFVEQKTVENSG